jgi:hypothetical protein
MELKLEGSRLLSASDAQTSLMSSLILGRGVKCQRD